MKSLSTIQSSALACSALLATSLHANIPQLSSWYTDSSAKYARIYETYEDEQAKNAVTTWDNGTYSNDTPVYSGISSIDYSDDFVYLTTNGLSAGHVMGPWYDDPELYGENSVFQNWPEAIDTIFILPRSSSIPENKTTLSAGGIGLMIDGTIIFSSSDTFSYDGASGSDTGPGSGNMNGQGTGVWNHDAYISESATFDKSNAHGSGNQLHYHASPDKLRHLLGDSIDAVEQPDGSFVYNENFNGNHSPIIGWLKDGLPLYGPYGYDDPTVGSTDTTVRRMVSGFIVRDGQNGTYDIPTNGRNVLPDWASRFQGIGPSVSGDNLGPDVSEIELPYFMEDYAYLGDLINPLDNEPYEQYVDYDLNEYNARYCRTPEFPEGTWAYFTNVNENGDDVFPYNIAVQFFGNPSNGGTTNNITETVTNYFLGGINSIETNQSIAPQTSSDDVVLVWNVIEGGTYTVLSSQDLDDWGNLAVDVVATDNVIEVTDVDAMATDNEKFYQLVRTSLPSDSSGVTSGTLFSATFSTSPPLPPESGIIDEAKVGGVLGSITSYNSATGAVTIDFDDSSLTPGSYSATLTFSPPMGNAVTITSTNQFNKE